jgi:glycosyltransferase involved in cell wall biosynthesis
MIKKKNLCIVGSAGIPANYGGFETLVEYISKSLAKEYNVYVFCSSKNYEKKYRKFNGAKLIYINLNANGVQGIFYDIISLYKSFKINSEIIILGASGALSLPLMRLFFKSKKIITNVDGIEWKRAKWGFIEKYVLKLSEFIACQYSNIIVSDNIEIKKYIDSKYKINSEYIPYGGNHVKNPNKISTIIRFKSKNYAIKVCRIEPENNVEMVLRAFKKVKNKNLVIVGNWKKSKYGKKLFNDFSNCKNIQLLNPIYDLLELNKLRFNSNLYIHGHSAGGTNPSLVEAMFLKVMIFCFDVEFNRKSTNNKAFYFKNYSDLVELLSNKKIINSSKLILNLTKIAQNEYIWEKVSNSYLKILHK